MKKLLSIFFVFTFFSLNAQVDVGIIKIISPEGVISTYNNAPVKAWVKNFGSQSVDTIPIVISINNSSLLHDTIVISGGLPSGDSSLIQSNITYSSPIGIYQLCVSSSLANDNNIGNNEACTCIYGSLYNQENDLSIIDIRPTINQQGAGTYEIFELLIKNTGKKPVDTVYLKASMGPFYISNPLVVSDTLFPDSSKWLRINNYYNRVLGQNEVSFFINDPSDVISCNDSIFYIYWGQRRTFDLSIDSIQCQPVSGDTLLSDSVDLLVFYTNQGTQAINQSFSFVSSEHLIGYDTIIKTVNLQPLQTDTIKISTYFIAQVSTEADWGVRFLETDSNKFNNEVIKSYIRSTVSLQNIHNNEKIVLYPNPTSGLIYIDTQYPNQEFDIEVYNIEGIKVLAASSANKIDLRKLSEGIYFVKINVGGIFYMQKIIKIK